MSLGDTFKEGWYKIHQKLGYGGFATVWVARDNI
jgi:serine/threonine protein kinase